MYLVAGFFDESSDEESGGLCYTVAGFIGNQLATSILELRWRDMLNKYELEYFKASELNAGMGQFQKYRDDPSSFEWRPFSQREKDIFTEIKTAFTDVIIGCGDGLYGIGAVVILPDLERLRTEYDHAKALPIPYFICSNMVLVEAGSEMIEQNIGFSGDKLCWLRPIFDSHEEYSGRAKVGGIFSATRIRTLASTCSRRTMNPTKTISRYRLLTTSPLRRGSLRLPNTATSRPASP